MLAESHSTVHIAKPQEVVSHELEAYSSEYSIQARLRAQLGYKLLLLFTVPVTVYVPYFALQSWVLFPVREMPITPLERIIPFQPDAVWPYNSIYFLVLLPPALMTSRSELNRFAHAFLGIGFIANLFFLFWPTTCKRPILEQPHAAYEFLVSVDAPLHACPSLHAAFSVLGALCLAPALGKRLNWIWSFVAWLWVAVIFYATLATKQHVLTDLLAGSALATIGYYLAFRRTNS